MIYYKYPYKLFIRGNNMEENTSVLKRRQRQPKLYIDLPSKGKFYEAGSLRKHEELAVYSMTAADEIAVKTPDALLTGNATANLIKSCVPDIINPWAVPTTDLYTLMCAIRIASYGDNTTVGGLCPKCKQDNTYNVALQPMIDQFARNVYKDVVEVDGYKIRIRPLSYKEYTEIGKKTTTFQRTIIQQVEPMKDDEEKRKLTQELYDSIGKTKFETVVSAIDSIEVDGEIEENKQEITDFLKNSESHIYNAVENQMLENNVNFSVPQIDVNCGGCEEPYKVEANLDYSNFFV